MSELQGMFDTVVRHLREQGAKSEGQIGPQGVGCMYRDPEGRKCAIGCLISDEDYTPDLENKQCGHGLVLEAAGLDTSEKLSLARDLQEVHDCWEPQHWERRLQKVSQAHKLEMPK